MLALHARIGASEQADIAARRADGARATHDRLGLPLGFAEPLVLIGL